MTFWNGLKSLFSGAPDPMDSRFHPDYVLATVLMEEGKVDLAIAAYRKAAEAGAAVAQHDLGVFYAEGRGVPFNYKHAAAWYHKAALQGLAVSQANLGFCYAEGRGMPQDYAQAVYWFEKAAAQGFADGQFKLGVMYANGNGVARDYDEAFRLISLAAAQGHADARRAREEVAKRAVHAKLRGMRGF